MPRRRPRFTRSRGPTLPDAAGVMLGAELPAPPKRRVQVEARHQEQVVAWLRLHQVLFFHAPNGEARSARTGARLRRMGVSKGVPDIIIVDRPPASPGAIGLAFEMKTAKGRLTPEQKQWLEDFRQRGWLVAVYKSANEAIFGLEQLGYNKIRLEDLSRDHLIGVD